MLTNQRLPELVAEATDVGAECVVVDDYDARLGH